MCLFTVYFHFNSVEEDFKQNLFVVHYHLAPSPGGCWWVFSFVFVFFQLLPDLDVLFRLQ